MELKKITYDAMTGSHDVLPPRTGAETFLRNQMNRDDAKAYATAMLEGVLDKADPYYMPAYQDLHAEAIDRLNSIRVVRMPADILGVVDGQ